MAKQQDTYESWEKDGILDERLNFIQELVSKRIVQGKIAEALGISERTLIKLKNKHARLKNAFTLGDLDLKDKLIDAIYKKAVGYESEEIQTVVEETKNGTKKRIVKSKKVIGPDFNSARYLLIIKFGRDYNDKKEEINIMEKRVEKGEEVWSTDFFESEEEDNKVYYKSGRKKQC